MSDVLFDGYDPAEPIPQPTLSSDRRRTVRQAQDVATGRHPLTRGPLHPDASRDRTRESGRRDPFTCGTCVHRDTRFTFPKCLALGPKALSHSAATDVRAWWPACPSYEPSTEASA